QTSERSPQYPLHASAAMYSIGATVQDTVVVRASDPGRWDGQSSEPVEWTNPVNVAIAGDGVTRIFRSGWAAGALSTKSILSDAGYVEFTATENDSYRIAGLTKRAVSADYSAIDFGILLTAEHEVTIYESGDYRGFIGYYSPGDRFRVSVDARVV